MYIADKDGISFTIPKNKAEHYKNLGYKLTEVEDKSKINTIDRYSELMELTITELKSISEKAGYQVPDKMKKEEIAKSMIAKGL